MAFWDGPTSRWNAAGSTWQAPPPPGPGWGDDWRWWYQVTNTPVIELNPLLVEARWSTDSHTMGDGTFRGDIQPGTLTVRLWDPEHQLDNLNKLGAVWALYRPTGACWCWFYDSLSRGLFAAGDPAAADCVFVGSQWPSRLTTPTQDTAFPSQSAAARLTAIVAWLNNALVTMNLPALTGNIAAQSQLVLAAAADNNGLFNSYLGFIREAATNGVAWMAASATPAGVGQLTLNYARWETNLQRVLDRSQIVAGPPTTASTDFLITLVQWAATSGANGTQSSLLVPSSVTNNVNIWGFQGPSALRLWGNVTAGQPEYSPCFNTGYQINYAHSNPSEQVLSSVSLQSGGRTTPKGGTSTALWDPRSHVYSPTDVASIMDDAGLAHFYRVTKSDHRLTATIWETAHTLEKYVAPVPLP